LRMANPEVTQVIQRHINNGQYSEAVDAINIVLSQSGSRLPEAFGAQLFPTLVNAEEEYTVRCCRALEKLLDFTPVDTLLCQMEVQLKQGFEHHSPLVKKLCLRQLYRAVNDRRNLKIIGEVGIMKHAILLLGDEDSSVVKECNKILVALASYDEGVIILYSDQGVKLLKEVMGRSDTIRYRVFDVIIDGILISDQAFEFAMSAGFIPKILEDLESSDVLLQLTALENVSRLSDSPTAYSQLKSVGIFKGIGTWLVSRESSQHSNASYTVPSVIKLFAKLCQKHNIDMKQFCEECPEYVPAVCSLLASNDISIKFACVDVLTLLNARVDGKQVLLSALGAAHAVHILSHLATRGVDEIKDRALVALAHIFSSPEVYIPDFENKTEVWFRQCHNGLIKDTLQLLSLPSPPRQCAAASLLSNLAVHKYGIEAITQVPGWCERLVERRYSVDRDAQNQRFSLILAIKRSPVIEEHADRDIINKLTKFINEGASYTETAPTAILEL